MELFKIFGRIALKGQAETEDGLDSVAGKASGVGQALLKGIGTFAKWGAAAATAAATATAALVKSAVTAYSMQISRN